MRLKFSARDDWMLLQFCAVKSREHLPWILRKVILNFHLGQNMAVKKMKMRSAVRGRKWDQISWLSCNTNFSFAKSTFCFWYFKMMPVCLLHQKGNLAKLSVKHPSNLHPTINLPFFSAEKWPHGSWPMTCSSLRPSSSSCCMSGWNSAKKTLPVLTSSVLGCMPEHCCPGVPLALINFGLSRGN